MSSTLTATVQSAFERTATPQPPQIHLASALKTEQPSEPAEPGTAATGWSWRTTVPVAIAIVMLAVAFTDQWRETLINLLGPGRVALQEVYQSRSDGPKFDHSQFDALLAKHVDSEGGVDYVGLQTDAALLDAYIVSIGHAPFADLERDEKLSLLINAYNAFTLRLILDYYPVKSIKDIPAGKRWDAKRWRVGSMTLSLNEIEHEHIRPKFAEPRIHFALVCAAISCPKLRNEAYQAKRIEEQLDDQTRYVHSRDLWFRYQPGAKIIHLTKLYDWYGSDFAQVADSVLAFAARYSPPLKASLDAKVKPRIKWLKYDWALNDRKSKR